MTCPKCEKREKESEKCLSDCESRCKELETRSHRLQLVLVCMGTILGQEVLESAFSTADAVTSTGLVEAPVSPDNGDMGSGMAYTPRSRQWASESSYGSSVLFSDLPPLTTWWIDGEPDWSKDDLHVDDWGYSSRVVPNPGVMSLGIFWLLTKKGRNRG